MVSQFLRQTCWMVPFLRRRNMWYIFSISWKCVAFTWAIRTEKFPKLLYFWRTKLSWRTLAIISLAKILTHLVPCSSSASFARSTSERSDLWHEKMASEERNWTSESLRNVVMAAYESTVRPRDINSVFNGVSKQHVQELVSCLPRG